MCVHARACVRECGRWMETGKISNENEGGLASEKKEVLGNKRVGRKNNRVKRI